MERQDIEARVRAAYGATAGASDPRPAFSDEIVWHVPGNNPVSGSIEEPMSTSARWWSA
jgi:hypothetical protein